MDLTRVRVLPSDKARESKRVIVIIDQIIKAGEKEKRARARARWWELMDWWF